MIILHRDPLGLVFANSLFVLVAYGRGLEISHCADIDLVIQNGLDSSVAPQMNLAKRVRLTKLRCTIVSRCQNMLIVQHITYLNGFHTACVHLEDAADDRCSLRVRNGRVFFIIAYEITVGCDCAFIFAGLCTLSVNGSQLFGGVCRMPFIFKNTIMRLLRTHQ